MTGTATVKPLLNWLALCVLLTAVASFLVARLPVTLQKPGITAIWFGALLGACATWTANVSHVQSPRLVIGFAVFLGIVAAIVTTGQRYWLYRDATTETYLGDLGNSSVPTMNWPMFTENPTLPANFREEFRASREAALEKLLPFDVYLTRRLAAFGIEAHSSTTAIGVVCWIVEIALAGVAAGLVAWWTFRAAPPMESPA